MIPNAWDEERAWVVYCRGNHVGCDLYYDFLDLEMKAFLERG